MNATRLTRVRFFGAILALTAAIAIAGLLASSDTAFAVSFNPGAALCVVDTAGDSDCNGTAGAHADVNGTFCIGLGADCKPGTGDETTDLQFAYTINFTPPQWAISKDADVPDGALVNKLTSTATLGLINGACSTSLGVEFDMMDATTAAATLVPFKDPQATDKNDTQGSEPDDQFDVNSSGLPLGVVRYPDYLSRIFEGLTPISRQYGQTKVAGIEVSLNFVLFAPGTVFETRLGTVKTDPRLGYPSVTVLQAVGDPATRAEPGDSNAVSDFCSPLLSNTNGYGMSKDNPDTSANEGGKVLRTNPPAGTYFYTNYAVSQRDADGDGIENGLDPCPTVANPTWNPRINPGQAGYTDDADQDSLPDDAGCDPNPADPGPISGGNRDQDKDQYGNRADNCPLVPNSKGVLGGAGPDNQADGDADGIGDACDKNPTTPDGDRGTVCLVSEVKIGAGGAKPTDPTTMQPCDPNAVIPIATGPGQTPVAGQTPTSTTDGTDSGVGATGVGALAPAAGSIPAWATALSGLGGAGLLGSVGAFVARVVRRKRP